MSEKKILSVVDPTAAEQPALARAAWLAKVLGASLELFICDYDQYLAGGRLFESKSLEKARESLLRNHTRRLKKLAEPYIQQGLDVTVDARWGKPLDHGIVRKVIDAQPILVVKDTHYHDVLKRTVLSNTDWSLIRSCPAPLLLVKEHDLSPTPTILAAVDPMHEHDKPAELDRSILAFAKELASAVSGQLHVLHSYDTAPILAAAADSPGTAISIPAAELTAGMEREHREALDRLLAAYPVDADHVHLIEGPPHQVLIDTARDQQADVVVMGAVSRSGLKRIFVGSTAERTLDRLPCDLIVVKPPGFVAPELD